MASDSGLPVSAAASSGNSTLAATVASWPLLAGMAMLMVGNGLLVSLLGVRASNEGFANVVTGLIMSGYFAGFFAGTWLTPRIIETVGHVRVFAALASIASIAALVHSLWIDPVSWIAMRALAGFSFAGLYVVAESWLNAGSGNETRGRMLAIYMLTQYSGLAVGQLLLTAADSDGYVLFILSSIVVSAALVPILLSPRPAPRFEVSAPLGLRELIRISPLGAVATTINGLTQGAFFSLGAVYATAIGMNVAGVAVFMAAVTLGGSFLQWPIGRFSDAIDRRLVIALVSFGAAAACIAAGVLAQSSLLGLIVASSIFGGLALPVYSLSVAHTNDHLKPEQIVAASSGLVVLFGTGSIFGPLLASAAMDLSGPSGFFWYLAAVTGTLGVFTLYRMTASAPVPMEDQAPYVPLMAQGGELSTGGDYEAEEPSDPVEGSGG
jgi:MFS family permease